MRFEPQNPDKQRHISTLKRAEPINLTLYANGIFYLMDHFDHFLVESFIFSTNFVVA